MKGTKDFTRDARDSRASQDVLEELFRHATARERPAAGDEKAIRDALHSEWQERVGRRKRHRAIFSIAAAASVFLAVLVAANLVRDPTPPSLTRQLASVEKVMGSVFVHTAGEGPVTRAEPFSRIQTGQQIVTGLGSRLALRWLDGTSVRLDQNSEVRFTSSGDVLLVSGQIYVDSGAADAVVSNTDAVPLVILTPAGAVRHIGTQYLAQVTEKETLVSVREGKVVLSVGDVELLTVNGEQLEVRENGARSRKAISSYGELWQWTEELAPVFESDGRVVTDFLDWVGRESGYAVEFASPRAEQLAGETTLRGHVELDPMQALKVMLQTTDLVAESHSGIILIAMRE